MLVGFPLLSRLSVVRTKTSKPLIVNFLTASLVVTCVNACILTNHLNTPDDWS